MTTILNYLNNHTHVVNDFDNNKIKYIQKSSVLY